MDISSCTLCLLRLFYWWMTQKWFPSLTFGYMETLSANNLEIIKSFPEGLNTGQMLCLLHIVLSPVILNMRWHWNGAYLQERADKGWSRLFKQQDEELRKVEAKDGYKGAFSDRFFCFWISTYLTIKLLLQPFHQRYWLNLIIQMEKSIKLNIQEEHMVWRLRILVFLECLDILLIL
ncbi:unnamed protein product [Lupinus luteus]|uniref:Uncharacterized protein n=1 Tax=Lupinus luteus TaxID=3873 RepID=A0AAV1WB21_LUPLU